MGGSDPTRRVLRLLDLLQTHRRWRSDELATELEVTTRTVRRDIDRLRTLGYPVDSAPGLDGGYRLAAGAHLPPLMFDDDEAVALAVGLWSAASSPLEGAEDTALRALAKIESLMPERVRRRTSAITSSVSTHRWHDLRAEQVDIATVSTVTATCRDDEELRFSYVSKSGDATERLVEPHRLVAVDRRWYLLAWDVRRSDWRTFRLDRMSEARAAGVRFVARDIPGGDPAAFVAENLGATPRPFVVTVRVSASFDELDAVAPWLTESCVARRGALDVELRATAPDRLVTQIARIASVFDVQLIGRGETVDEVRRQLGVISARLA